MAFTMFGPRTRGAGGGGEGNRGVWLGTYLFI